MKKLEFVDNSLDLAKEFHQIFRMMEQEVCKIFFNNLMILHFIYFISNIEFNLVGQ